MDDLEFSLPEEPDGLSVLTALLAGPGALARRLGGRLGEWLASVHARLHPAKAADTARVPFGLAKRIGTTVELSVPKEELELSRFEEWVRVHFVAKIPGAARAPE